MQTPTYNCPSCLDGVHGDCALWLRLDADPTVCTCPCPKRCAKHHPAPSVPLSCTLPLGHAGPHYGGLSWIRDKDITPTLRAVLSPPDDPPGSRDREETG